MIGDKRKQNKKEKLTSNMTILKPDLKTDGEVFEWGYISSCLGD